MEKYQIKKAGIGMKANPSDLEGRVFEHNVLGLSYIMEAKPYANDKDLGYPVMLITNIYGEMHTHIAFVEEDAETWNGEITTESGELVNYFKTRLYINIH